MDPTHLINNFASAAQRASAADRGQAVHRLCDALLASPAHLLDAYLPLVLDFAGASDAGSRRTVSVFIGLLLSREPARIVKYIDTLTKLLGDVAPDVVEASARAVSGLLRPAFLSLAALPSQDTFRSWEASHSACAYVMMPYLRPGTTSSARRALVDVAIAAAAVCAPAYAPPPGSPEDEQLAGCNSIRLDAIPMLATSGVLPPAVSLAAGMRLVAVEVGSLLRDCSEARAALGAEDYAYLVHRLVRLAIWRPALADACARAVAVFATLPPAHVCVALSPSDSRPALPGPLHTAVRGALGEGVAFTQVPSAAAAFSALLGSPFLGHSAVGGPAGGRAQPVLRCPVQRSTTLDLGISSSLAPTAMAELVLANLPNPPPMDVTRAPLPPSAAAALEGLLAALSAAEEAKARARVEAAEAEARAKAPAPSPISPARPKSTVALLGSAAEAIAAGAGATPAAARSAETMMPWARLGQQLPPSVGAASDAVNRLLADAAAAAGAGAKASAASAAILGVEGRAGLDHLTSALGLLLPPAEGGGEDRRALPPSPAAISRLLGMLSPRHGPPAPLAHISSLLVVCLHRLHHATGLAPQDVAAASSLALRGIWKATCRALAAGSVASGARNSAVEGAATDALTLFLLDAPRLEWTDVTALLLRHEAPPLPAGVATDESGAAELAALAGQRAVAIAALESALALRPAARAPALDALLALVMVDGEEGAGGAVTRALGRGLDAASGEQAVRIGAAALAAAGALEGLGEGEERPAKRSRATEGAAGPFASPIGPTLPACVAATALLSAPVLPSHQSVSLLGAYLAVAQAIPPSLDALVPWAAALVAGLGGTDAPLAPHFARIVAAVRTAGARVGLQPVLSALLPAPVLPRHALSLLLALLQGLADEGVKEHVAASQAVEVGADAGEETAKAAATHPRDAAALTELLAAVRHLSFDDGSPPHALLAPFLALLPAAEVRPALTALASVAAPGTLRYAVQRLLHTPNAPPALSAEEVFASLVHAADAIPARAEVTPAERVGLLTEASAALFDEKGVMTDRVVQAGLQRVMVEAVGRARAAPDAVAVLPVLAMRCIAVAARMYPELRSALVEQLLALLRTVGGAAFESLDAIRSWPAEEAVAAGPRWDGFTRLVKLTVPLSFSLLLVLPEPHLQLLLGGKGEAELRRRATKWFSTLPGAASAPAHVRALLQGF
jgi:hypothetical protein